MIRGSLPYVAGDWRGWVPGLPYAFLSASGRPCTDANLTRCKREEIVPQAFAGNTQILSKYHCLQLPMQEKEKQETRLGRYVHSQIFQLQICLICDGFQNWEKFEQDAPPSKQIKKRTMCPSWIFRGQPGWNPILALCISHTWWCASPLHPQLITTRRLRTNLSKDTIHLLIIRRGRDCIPTTDCAAIIHNTEPQPRTNNEGLCRNVKQSPSTCLCQWVSQ